MATTYLRGVVLNSGTAGITNFVWQKTAWSMKASTASIMTSKGNTQAVDYFEHIAEVKIDAIFASEDTLPTQGDVVVLTGLKIPAITEAGVKTGNFQITGTVGDTVNFQVTEISGDEETKDYHKVSLTVVRYIEKGLPV
jgi:hypothetical protein